MAAFVGDTVAVIVGNAVLEINQIIKIAIFKLFHMYIVRIPVELLQHFLNSDAVS